MGMKGVCVCEQTFGLICLQLSYYRRQMQWSHLLSRALIKYESSISFASTPIFDKSKKLLGKSKKESIF